MHHLPVFCVGTAVAWMATASAHANVVIVNRDTGSVSWFNSTGTSLGIAAYTLLSASGGIAPENWLSITENYDADSGGKIDAANSWFLLGRDLFNLSEATFGTTTVDDGAVIDLGRAWKPGHIEDLVFEYLDVRLDVVLPGNVLFITAAPGDFNANGIVEQGDLDLVLLNWGRMAVPSPSGWINDLPTGLVDQDELDKVLLQWGSVGQASMGPIGAALHAASIPEPQTIVSGLMLAAIALAGVSFADRGRSLDRQ